jgi:hypothetical protein
MINRSFAECQIELKPAEGGPGRRGQVKKCRKSPGPLLPLKEKVTKNIQPGYRRPGIYFSGEGWYRFQFEREGSSRCEKKQILITVLRDDPRFIALLKKVGWEN